jgi:hypothetical protein
MTRKSAWHCWRWRHDASRRDKAGRPVPDQVVLASWLMQQYRADKASYKLNGKAEQAHGKHVKQKRTEQ